MKSSTFIEKVVKECMVQFQTFEHCTFVIPGKRPIVFFRKAFQEENYQGILPQFLTIEELKEKIARVHVVKGVNLWLEAFSIFQKIKPEETFDNFIKWIPTTLNDFDDISIFTENPKAVFEYLISEERIKNWNVEPEELMDNNELVLQNILFWQQAATLYNQINTKLSEEKRAMQGFLNRIASETTTDYLTKNPNEHYIFIGFNAFNPQEINIVKTFQKENRITFFWDSDQYYLHNNQQEAGFFLRRNFAELNLKKNEINWVDNQFTSQKNIEVIACAKNISQVKLAGTIVQKLIDQNSNLQNTALVLCDETLLNFAKESIPENASHVNITMGFPLANTQQGLLVKKIIQSVQKMQNRTPKSMYYADLMEIISLHKPLSDREEKKLNQLIDYQNNEGKIYFQSTELARLLQETSLYFLADFEVTPIIFLQNLASYYLLYNHNHVEAFRREIYIKLSELQLVLANAIAEKKLDINWEGLDFLWTQALRNETLDFIGEPLSGLQIMGILETRLLGFENLILVSANEGKIPLGRTENSFIPYEIKRKFKINTFIENDAIYAYHFYRLLQHSNQNFLLYNSFPDMSSSGEPSRFIQQLDWESDVNIQYKNTLLEHYQKDFAGISIPKNKNILNKLQHWVSQKIYPTYLTSYLYNPVDFYLRHVLGIRTNNEEFEESISQKNFGNIVHDSLCELYKPYENEILSIKILEKMLLMAEKMLQKHIEVYSHSSLFQKGYNFLQYQIMLKTIQKIIQKDLKDVQEGNEIVLIQLEELIETKIPFQNTYLHFAGKIDRIDKLNNTIRIIDYKTANAKITTITPYNILKKFTQKDGIQEIQLLLYAKMTMDTFKCEELKCGIWSFKKPLQGVQYVKFQREDILHQQEIDLAISSITMIVEEILNPEIPFVENREIAE